MIISKIKKVIITVLVVLILGCCALYIRNKFFNKRVILQSTTIAYKTLLIPDILTDETVVVLIPENAVLKDTDNVSYWKYDSVEIYLNGNITSEFSDLGVYTHAATKNIKIIGVSKNTDALELLRYTYVVDGVSPQLYTVRMLDSVPEIQIDNYTKVIDVYMDMELVIKKYTVLFGQDSPAIVWYKDDVCFYAEYDTKEIYIINRGIRYCSVYVK